MHTLHTISAIGGKIYDQHYYRESPHIATISLPLLPNIPKNDGRHDHG